jgi:hypothetical protein
MSALATPSLPVFRHGKVLPLVLTANLLFWIYFWIDFGMKSYPYTPRPPVFDEPVPHYVFWGRALPWQQEMLAFSLKLVTWVHAPSWWAVRPYVWAVNQNPELWDKTFLGISPGGLSLADSHGLVFRPVVFDRAVFPTAF